MHITIKTDHKRIHGKRPNLSAQSGVADEIITALSNPAGPNIPLSPLPRKKNPRGGAVAAAILLFLPFVYPIVFFAHGVLSAHPLPVMMYPYLVLLARFVSNIGGLVLYLTARKASVLQKPIGWVALAAFLLPLVSTFLVGTQQIQVDPSSISPLRGGIAFYAVVIALLCMLALCVFCVLLLVRVFQKKKTPDTL